MMLIAGDGKANVFNVDALDHRKWARHIASDRVNDGTFDLVLTNPPFAGKITTREQLSQYELYLLAQSGELIADDEEENGDGDSNTKTKARRKVSAMKRDVLFLERCLRLLRPGGRVAIVLPQGNLNNVGTRGLRRWLLDKARLLAVVGLHVNTFKPHTGTKTSVLFLQKWGGEAGEAKSNYPVFMATSAKSGKNNSGEYVPLTDAMGRLIAPDGRVIDPTREKSYVDHDLDDVAEAFIRFAKQEGLSFWK